jgi:hypothetical protein
VVVVLVDVAPGTVLCGDGVVLVVVDDCEVVDAPGDPAGAEEVVVDELCWEGVEAVGELDCPGLLVGVPAAELPEVATVEDGGAVVLELDAGGFVGSPLSASSVSTSCWTPATSDATAPGDPLPPSEGSAFSCFSAFSSFASSACDG